MAAIGMLAIREHTDPTSLELGWGEKLTVPLYAFDDHAAVLRSYGQCLWDPQKIRKDLHDFLLYVITEDACVYKNSYSWAERGVVPKGQVVVSCAPPTLVEGEIMIPLEGGGAVQKRWTRQASQADLALDPMLYVVDVDVPKSIRRRFARLRRRRLDHDNDHSHTDFRTALRNGFYTSGYAAKSEQETVSPKYRFTCLIDALRDLGSKVPYTRDGPLWTLAHGNEILEPFGKRLKRVDDIRSVGKYIIHRPNKFGGYGHDFALRVHKESWDLRAKTRAVDIRSDNFAFL